MVGQRLAHYEILEKLGAGGMGVVYRARDTRLERIVALKVLGEQFLTDETARARLLREARTASALNHPNICTIYDVGEAGGQSYIAMEFVEGRALAASIPSDGMPIEMVFRYAAQVADALAHAHDRGIMHRDLKSANVVITPEGRAKVLDFGLAKRLPEGPGESTVSRGLTEAGTMVGTLAYIAPEVFRGEPADSRSDLWAFGVMLHEMASGRLPFQGKTAFEFSFAVLREPPAPLPPGVPAGLRTIILHCLAKEPAQRYQRASEVRAAIEALQSTATIIPPAAVAEVPRRRWLWGVTGGALVASGGGLKIWRWLGARESAPAGPRVSTGGPASKNREANEYFEKGMLFLMSQYDLQRARQMLEKALELDAHFAEARGWYGFTNVLMIDSGYSNDSSWLYKAEEEIRRALQDDPGLARGHSTLAAVYTYQRGA